MKKRPIRYLFLIIAAVLWIAAIFCVIKANASYQSSDLNALQTILGAQRWYPACFIGAIISTAAAFVIDDLYEHIDKDKK